jgi:hypothetical protein
MIRQGRNARSALGALFVSAAAVVKGFTGIVCGAVPAAKVII